MTANEFSNQFDVLYNNITSNQAPGLNEYEKSVFLTKAQNEIVKNYFTAQSKGNTIGQGFDDSAKRQADFSCLMKTKDCEPIEASPEYEEEQEEHAPYVYVITHDGTAGEPIEIDELPTVTSDSDHPLDSVLDATIEVDDVSSRAVTINTYLYVISALPSGVENGDTIVYSEYQEPESEEDDTEEEEENVPVMRIDPRSWVYKFPDDVFIVINEAVTVTTSKPSGKKLLQVIPLRYDTYMALMSKPYKRPVKYQAWRLINLGTGTGVTANKQVELIVGYKENVTNYNIRYIRSPKPIILEGLDGLSIGGYTYGVPQSDTDLKTSGCELDPILHEEILQRAVELAKVAWTNNGQDNVQLAIEAGKRSE